MLGAKDPSSLIYKWVRPSTTKWQAQDHIVEGREEELSGFVSGSGSASLMCHACE